MRHYPNSKNLLVPNSCITLKTKFPVVIGSPLKKQTKNVYISNAVVIKQDVLPSRGHLAKSGAIFSCHNRGRNAPGT